MSGTLSFTNPLPKAPLAVLHSRRNFLEIGLFSGLYKPEVNEYIVATRNRRGRKTFRHQKPSSRAITAFSAHLGNNTSVWECAGSGADGWSTLSGERGRPGDVTLEESAENLRGKEMLLSGAQGLSERSELSTVSPCI